MKFIQSEKKVNINGEEFDLELFLSVEPEYTKKDGWIRIYDGIKKNILTNGKITINENIPWEDGERYLTRVSDLMYLKAYLSSEK